MPPNVAETLGGKIYTFGSYRLGVQTKGENFLLLLLLLSKTEVLLKYIQYKMFGAKFTHYFEAVLSKITIG